jgi:hypothetical protein
LVKLAQQILVAVAVQALQVLLQAQLVDPES